MLESKDVDVIIHQVNCLCIKAHGLSQKIAEKFPWGDIYIETVVEKVEEI